MDRIKEKLTTIADEVRELSGISSSISLDDMKNNLSDANNEVDSQTELIEQIISALDGKAVGGEQVAPTISVNSSSGLITATAGTKSSTHQLAFQPAKTITPSTASQIAVSSGYYTGGNITVAGDSNLVAGNIKSGVSIFGVNGNYAGSGENNSMEDSFVTRNFTSYTNDRVTTIGYYAFAYYSELTSVDFPAVTTINPGAFRGCSSLTSINFPVVTTINQEAFYGCTYLTSVSFSNLTSVGMNVFTNCYRLTSVNFPNATRVATGAFHNCSRLTSVSLPVATTIGNSAFSNCSKLTSVDFPAVTSIYNSAFYNCFSLTSISFPVATTIGNSAFAYCSKLTSVDFPAVTTINSGAFRGCSSLTCIYLGASTVCTLSNSNTFSYTSIWSNKGYIFVPSSLVASYKKATNWTFFSNRIYSM